MILHLDDGFQASHFETMSSIQRMVEVKVNQLSARARHDDDESDEASTPMTSNRNNAALQPKPKTK